ncbi:lipopolysaccharide biosynthesis protein [Clostridium intestinale]|uniref:Membrane protein involved in the export of O-antigen and teichoic acid n=1 Tax=Clostridium intestinale DSM 6191 TaxID=1121320 RepID=A0A1M6DMK3_9CLOT|nr:oligosaccharide flippase family protein [Clostridium intestinale]SHI74476.1 Membrane protein involved in the export of O-antigen and teichoic acid [Clostridium intestinale DSM 6191]
MKDKFNQLKTKIMQNRILKNLFIILTGDSLVSVIGIVNLTIAIWTIGLEGNGVIAIIQSYVLVFNDIFNFQSFNALIKFLPQYIENKNITKCKEIIKQSLILDISSAIIALIAGYICLSAVANFMNWDSEVVLYVKIYLITIIFNITGTAIGILRIFDKFTYTTYTGIITSIFKLGLYLIGFMMKMSFMYFIIVEVILESIRNISLLIFALKVLKQQKLNKFYRERLKFDREFFVFNVYSNIVFTIDVPVRYLTTFVINKYLGDSMTAIYKIFQKLGSIIEKLGSPLSQIIFPEMSIMVSKNDYDSTFKLNRKLTKVLLLAGSGILVGTALTYKLWMWLFIPDYNNYIIQLLLYFFMIVISYSAVGLHSLFITLGFIKYNFPILLVVNSLYLIILYYGVMYYTLTGVIVALILQTMMVVIAKIIILSRNNYKILG